MEGKVKIWCTTWKERAQILNKIYGMTSFKFRQKLYGVPMGFLIDFENNHIAQTKSDVVFRVNKGIQKAFDEFLLDCEIKIGDTIIVTNTGSTYSSYEQWPGLGKYKTHFKVGAHPTYGQEYKVVNIDKHGLASRTIALIQDIDAEHVFMIGIEGVVKVS